MRLKNIHINLLFLTLILLFSIACNKNEDLTPRSLVPTQGVLPEQAKPKARFVTLVKSFYENDTIKIVNTSSSPVTEVNYQWYLVSNNTNGLVSSEKEIGYLIFNELQTAQLSLVATNKYGTDTFSLNIEIKEKPKSAQITAITLDSVNYTNPLTGGNWNVSGGPNVLYKFYDIHQVWVDSTGRAQNSNLYGWSSTPPANLVLENVNSTPISWQYPSALRYILFSRMLDEHTLKIYNKDSNGDLQLIASIPFIFVDYFRNNLYADPGGNPDISLVKLRSNDGKTVITIKIKYLT